MIAPIMKDVLFARPELGTRDGLSYALFLPDGEPRGGVVILHGAGSAKESHYDFARLARERGFASLAYDARGHGRSDGEFGPDAVADALSMCALAGEHAPRIALRGSSLGAACAILAAAASGGGIRAVVAICPATEDLLLRGLRAGRLEGFRADVERLEQWLKAVSVEEAAAALSPGTALMLMHARGDEQVPYTVSEELHAAAGEPKRLLVLPGGHHRSLQHDLEMQNESLRFVERALG
jgi:alpha-beta hydrolase superfamily lysophospholipase